MRVSFYQIFQVLPNGMISPKTQIHINGVTMGPGAAFGTGAFFGGVNLAALQGKDLEVEQQGGVVVLKGHYQ